MAKEGIIEASVWIIMIIALLVFVPKKKMREASAVYLFKLFLTWGLGLFVVQMKWIEYPDRFIFPYAHKSNFTFEFFVYPSICVLFMLYYPEKKRYITQLGYFAAYCSIMTLLEVLIEHYTQLIHYIKWTWYWTWISLFLTFSLSRIYYIWFFRIKSKT
ncbi:hypothetical protein SAMN04487897_1124 [Paenibacillus sp. yr247]|uniref:CBO0543 family protein n=1 Tax=Paenibacillus sp. yr247 TaxID=1761880 RepID=UPI000886ADD0|nr:CBO0543 family protein [Paenibacillus sp. yr247]SDO32301.1 hypothetical protein SAMN04487897_1124 [Paenibacillus sp. yr247]